MDLSGDDLVPDRAHVFHIRFPKEWRTGDIIHIFQVLHYRVEFLQLLDFLQFGYPAAVGFPATNGSPATVSFSATFISCTCLTVLYSPYRRLGWATYLSPGWTTHRPMWL